MANPKNEDVQKINAEVNQLVNQRLSLTILAVTIFGAIIAWLIPKSSNGSDPFVFVGSILLIIVLSSLFLLNHNLTYMLRILTTYLDETNLSNWEKHWALYRKEYKYWGYTKPQSFVFLVLGILATIFPFILAFVYTKPIEQLAGAIICILLGMFYIIFVIGMGFAGWFAKEEEIRRKWKEILNK